MSRFSKNTRAIIELSAGGSRVAIAPAYQGRVMTSTAAGPESPGFGWINPEVIATGIKPESERADLAKHIHVFGGEERLWFGPEGGPFALFFPPKVEQTFANWKTPAAMDTEALRSRRHASPTSATLHAKSFQLPNRAGTRFFAWRSSEPSPSPPPPSSRKPRRPLPEGVSAVAYTTAEHREKHRRKRMDP